MGARESWSITFFVGAVNLFLALLWGVLYGAGILEKDSIFSPKAMLLYVGTMFGVGFGLLFPMVERGMSDKRGIGLGQGLTGGALGLYVLYITVYVTRGSLAFL